MKGKFVREKTQQAQTVKMTCGKFLQMVNEIHAIKRF